MVGDGSRDMIFHAEEGMNISNYQIFRWEQRGTTVLIPVTVTVVMTSRIICTHRVLVMVFGTVWVRQWGLESGEVVFGGPVLIVYIYI